MHFFLNSHNTYILLNLSIFNNCDSFQLLNSKGFSLLSLSLHSLLQILSIFSSLFIFMLRLRLFLQESYKGNIATGFRSLCTVKMDPTGNHNPENQRLVLYQNVVVMRHGDRIDNFEPSWVSTAARPWDPPLVQAGKVRAFQTGNRLRQGHGFSINRVFVSPFLRCVQTAAEAAIAIAAVDEGPVAVTGEGVPIDPSKVKVSVEYGLSEMMNSEAIRNNVAPKDGNWGFDVSEREALLPAGTVDSNAEKVYKELPQWEEPVLETRARYHKTIKELADKYPTENLLFVTHGEGVAVALTTFKKDAAVNEVQYCGYVEFRRPIYQKDHTFTSGDFDLLTHSGQTGVTYFTSSQQGI